MRTSKAQASQGTTYYAVFIKSFSWADYIACPNGNEESVFDTEEEAKKEVESIEKTSGNWEPDEEYEDTGYTVKECAEEKVGYPRTLAYVKKVHLSRLGEWE